jgi:hypothetical protein
MRTQLPPPPPSYRLSHKVLGPVMKQLHLSCGHFSDLTLRAMDRPLTSGERFRHRLHLAVCSLCRRYERQMRSLGALVRADVARREETRPSPDFLEKVRRELEKTPRDEGGEPTD